MDAGQLSTEAVVNSIKITEGPVTHMSMAVKQSSRTPYSDATQVQPEILARIIVDAVVYQRGKTKHTNIIHPSVIPCPLPKSV